MSVRNIKNGDFGSEPGATRYLRVPAKKIPHPDHAVKKNERIKWFEEIIDEATSSVNPITGMPVGDILIFVHGYNNSPEVIVKRHRLLKKNLKAVGYKGALMTFDWPANDVALNYLEDRSDAKKVAIKLVEDGIALFSTFQEKGCEINVHLLCHSTGAFVAREAFDDADDRKNIASKNWSVSQIAFIGADLSCGSMRENDSKSSSLFRHCVRLTNYQNPFDSILKLSNVKRVGVAPRIGRVGLPVDASAKAVNVNCGNHWKRLKKPAGQIGAFDHSWHFGDKTLIRDLVYTLEGDIDRNVIPTREDTSSGLILRKQR